MRARLALQPGAEVYLLVLIDAVHDDRQLHYGRIASKQIDKRLVLEPLLDAQELIDGYQDTTTTIVYEASVWPVRLAVTGIMVVPVLEASAVIVSVIVEAV